MRIPQGDKMQEVPRANRSYRRKKFIIKTMYKIELPSGNTYWMGDRICRILVVIALIVEIYLLFR